MKLGYTHDGVISIEYRGENITDGIIIYSYSADLLTESNIAQQTACFIQWLSHQLPQDEFNKIEFGNVEFKVLR